ncbi:Ig-like domain-containing protein [bacterium]|nr:Ig-like domain-containing protein [Vicingaceae bacterium]MDB4060806.1 Ig-like domain-containing protein [Vicingaceae bacterium]MDC0004937.1 Ig-like domain-containing protein [bacterium]
MKYFSLIFGVLLLSACAQVVAPTGGDRDLTPPEVMSLVPENQSLNFNANSFTLEFDEYVVLRKLKEQLLVSPPLKYSLESKTKGKNLIFTIKDTLKENTTYVFNFGNAIVDLNEGNPLSNFQYVFSTGPVIDSLSFSGKVVDAFDLTAEKDAVLLLYPSNSEDSAVSKILPSYISRANEVGDFNITNLARGEYKLFALVDNNDNYLYDRADVKFGFLSNTINPENDTSEIKLFTFALPNEKQFIEKQEVFQNSLELTFNLAPKKIEFSLIDTAINNFVEQMEYEENKVKIWYKKTAATKLSASINEANFSDTIKFTTAVLNDSSKLELKKELNGIQNYFEPLSLLFKRPIKAIEKDSIRFIDSDSNIVEFSISLDTNDVKQAQIKVNTPSPRSIFLQVLPNSFQDLYGFTNDSISSVLTFNSAEDFGNLLVKVKNMEEQNLILQLADTKGSVLKEYYTTDTLYRFTNLKAAEYRLKLISDDNENKKWDTGDYYKKQQAERVIIYNEVIGIRQNWDKEIIWIVKP